jgi:hypothetical protein
MNTALPLLADTLTRTRFEWGRIQTNSDWILPIIVCMLIMLFVRYMYRRDSAELGPGISWLLTALRTATFYGLLVVYLEPQWRVEREVPRNSRVLLLADTSLSMRQTDAGPKETRGVSRAHQMAEVLEKSNLLPELRKVHDVVVLRFDQEVHRIAALDKELPTIGLGGVVAESAGGGDAARPNGGSAAETGIVWDKALAPVGTETRLGQSLAQVLHDEQNSPVAGVILLTDGGQNAGTGPEGAIQAAQAAKVPIFPIGLGSNVQPANVRVSDFTAPPRAYPGDRYTVTGYLQAQKMAGRVVTVELLSREAGSSDKKGEPGHVEASQQITLGPDGEVLAVPFELVPDRVGRRTLTLRVKAPADDQNPDDNQRESDVEIVDHKNRVLLLAGAPSREYQFLRALLHRDHSVLLDVLLQTAQPGISQDADKILDAFPSTKEELFQYDCIVALDPEWQAIGEKCVALLEKWVADQGGGLVVVPGPVNAGKSLGGWIQDRAMTKVRALYPVTFHDNLEIAASVPDSKDPWPLEFTREGLEAQFLWLDETASANEQAWAAFPGVYSCFPIRAAKPGATVFARFSDPRMNQAGQAMPYFVGQFYGSGRVFYLGSAEMWRLRHSDREGDFEKFYTKLIRHVSQGRLLRGSARGVLLVGQDHGYLVGSTVEVRAQLTTAQFEPLAAKTVSLQVVQPDGASFAITMDPDPSRAGTYIGHFTAGQEGTYRLELPIPETTDQRLVRRVQVKVPDLELENPQRNDALLSRLAQATGGHYYIGTEAALADGPQALVKQIKDRTRTMIFTAAPNPKWEETWLRWLMYILCGLLCFEWLLRRLVKLA